MFQMSNEFSWFALSENQKESSLKFLTYCLVQFENDFKILYYAFFITRFLLLIFYYVLRSKL